MVRSGDHDKKAGAGQTCRLGGVEAWRRRRLIFDGL